MNKLSFPFPENAVAALCLSLGAAVGSHAAQPHGRFQDFTNAPAFQQAYLETSTDIDFSKSSPAFPARDFPTWANPNFPAQIVDYYSQSLNSDVSEGTCYEISSTPLNEAASDPIAFVQNSGGTWVALADDNAGNNQFRARVFVSARGQRPLRISHYHASGTNESFILYIKKVKANSGAAITSQSCRLSNVPYHQADLNGGNPL